MPTSIYKYDGTLLTTVADSTLDTTHSTLRFPGKGYQNYGEPIMEDMVWMLQHFAGTTAPVNALSGQCWYDISTKTLKIYNGVTWDSASSGVINATAPLTGTNLGELWYDSVNLQLNSWNGSKWEIVGPLGSAVNTDPINKAIPSNSVMDSIRISDGSTNHLVWRITVGGTLLAIISKDAAFSPSPAVSGFASILPGINLNTNLTGIGVSGATNTFTDNKTNLPVTTSTYNLGSASKTFLNLYADNGIFTNAIAINAAVSSYALQVNGTTLINGTTTINGTVTLLGTSTYAPIKMLDGDLLSSPSLGAIEFDGNTFYLTSNVSGTTTRFAVEPQGIFNTNVSIDNDTKSVSTTTGALTINAGGAGIIGNVYVGGQIAASATDSVTMPGFTWDGNVNTGMYLSSANEIAFSIDSVLQFKISKDGAIGVKSDGYGAAGEILTSQGPTAAPQWLPVMPAGVVMNFAGVIASIPTGWMECAGQSLLRASYPDLFAAIGTVYGAVDSTHFDIPDLRGEFVRGWDNGAGVDAGRVFGSNQADELRSHTHSYQTPNIIPNGERDNNQQFGDTFNPAVTGATGGGETRPRNVAMFYIIKT